MLLFNIIDRLGKKHYEMFHKPQHLPNEIIEILESLTRTCMDELEQNLRLFLIESILSLTTHKKILETMNDPCISNLSVLCVQLEREPSADYPLALSHVLLSILKIMQRYHIKSRKLKRSTSVISEKQPLLQVNEEYNTNQEKIQHQLKHIEAWMLTNTPVTIQSLWKGMNPWVKRLQTSIPPAYEEKIPSSPPSYDELYQLFSILDHTFQTVPRFNDQRAEEVPDLMEKKIARASKLRLDNQRASLPITKLEMQLLKSFSRSLDNQRASF